MFTQTLKLALALALCLQVNAHAIVAPAIGVKGTPVRNDVKKPSTQAPCGAGVNIASALAASTPVTAAADGTFTATAISFNGGTDGSRDFTAKVDTTGTGNSFTGTVTLVQNGEENPAAAGSEQIVAKLPAGTTCTGGKCLVQFISTPAKFGNCVLVQQAGATAGSNAASGAAAAAGASAATGATGKTAAGSAAGTANNAAAAPAKVANAAGNAAGAGAKAKAAKAKAAKAQGTAAAAKHPKGRTAAPRELLESLDGLDARDIEIQRRGFMGWVWAPSF